MRYAGTLHHVRLAAQGACCVQHRVMCATLSSPSPMMLSFDGSQRGPLSPHRHSRYVDYTAAAVPSPMHNRYCKSPAGDTVPLLAMLGPPLMRCAQALTQRCHMSLACMQKTCAAPRRVDQRPAYLGQLIGRRCDTDIPWFPARGSSAMTSLA